MKQKVCRSPVEETETTHTEDTLRPRAWLFLGSLLKKDTSVERDAPCGPEK